MWWCYVDWTWSEQDKFSGQGWFSNTRVSNDILMGTMNFSMKHVSFICKMWSLDLGHRVHDDPKVFGCSVCNKFLSNWKIVFSQTEWQAFTSHMKKKHRCKKLFSHFAIKLIPIVKNTITDKLARDRCNGCLLQCIILIICPSRKS